MCWMGFLNENSLGAGNKGKLRKINYLRDILVKFLKIQLLNFPKDLNL